MWSCFDFRLIFAHLFFVCFCLFSFLGKTGKESLKRKIMMFDIKNVTDEASNMAMSLLAGVQLDQAVSASPTAAIFYAFSKGI